MKRVVEHDGLQFELVSMENLNSETIPLSNLKDAPTQIGRHNFPKNAYLSRDAIRCYTDGNIAHIVVRSKNPVRLVSKQNASTVYRMDDQFEMREGDVLELAFDEATSTGYLPLALQRSADKADAIEFEKGPSKKEKREEEEVVEEKAEEKEASEDEEAEAEPEQEKEDSDEESEEEEEAPKKAAPVKKPISRVDNSLMKSPKAATTRSPTAKKHVLTKADKIYEIENVRMVHQGNVIKKCEDYGRFEDNPKSLIGLLVAIHWPEQKCCYVGKIKKWDPVEKNHVVYYFNDRSEVEHDLSDEHWCFAREKADNWTLK